MQRIANITSFLPACLRHFFWGISALLLLASCVEELDLDTFRDAPEDGVLVVEAILTDQEVLQKVQLSRSVDRVDLEQDTLYNPFLPFGLGDRDTLPTEQNARVRLTGSGTTVNFIETAPGTYLSEREFALQQGTSYTLEIITQDGRAYESDPLQLNGIAKITGVYAEAATNSNGEEGVQIYVDAESVAGDTGNLRYAYEETYKIIAPSWNENDFRLTNYDPCALPEPTYTLEIVPREVQNRVCYNTVVSNRVIQAGIPPTSGAELNRYPLRFISKDDFILTHRYSILVKQLVQDQNAADFFRTLGNFSQSQNLFSQVQPGALRANVQRADGDAELVLGYVEAVSKSEERIFFEFDDIFPDDPLPPYPFTCIDHSSPESHRSYCASGPDGGGGCPQSIIERVNLGLSTYTGDNINNIGTCPGPYTYVNRACGDCTLLGSNVEPEFWEE